jgi:hypothetical protein
MTSRWNLLDCNARPLPPCVLGWPPNREERTVTTSAPVNDTHRKLREYDRDLDAGISFIAGMIAQLGYYPVRNDPGVRAWILENRHCLKPIADQRRTMF